MDLETKPKTLDEAIDILFQILDRETMDIFAARTGDELQYYHGTAGRLIKDHFRLVDGNPDLLQNCRKISGNPDLDGEQAAIYILETFWARLQIARH